MVGLFSSDIYYNIIKCNFRNYRSRHEYNPVRNTDLHHNRWDDRDDNSTVHKWSTSSRSDSSKDHSLCGSTEKLNENDQKGSSRTSSVSKNSEKNKGICDSKDTHEADNLKGPRFALSKRRAEKRNRELSITRKLPLKKSKLAKINSSESKQSMCHKNSRNSTDSMAKDTKLSETRKSGEKKTAESALTKISGTCSDVAKELEDLINSATPELQPKDKKVNTSLGSTVNIISVDDSNDSQSLTDNDVIVVQPEIPTVDLTDNSVEDISVYRNPETLVSVIKVESDNTPASSNVDKLTPNTYPTLIDSELQPVNTRLSYLNCFTAIFDDTTPVTMDISLSESPLHTTETTSNEDDQSNGRGVSKQLPFSETVSDQPDDCELQSATEKGCDIELPANNQMEDVNENVVLSIETENLIPHVKRNLSRSKSLSDLREDDANVTKFKSLRDLTTVKVDNSLLVPRIREKKKSLPASISPKQVQNDVDVVSTYKEELYWLLCVSADCAVRNENIKVKEENDETAPNDSSLDNSKVHNADTTPDISIFNVNIQQANSSDKMISSDCKTIEENVIKPVQDTNLNSRFEDVHQSPKIEIPNKINRKKSDQTEIFNPPKKRRRIIVFDSSDDDSDLHVNLKQEALKNLVPKKRSKQTTQQKVKKTEVKSETHAHSCREAKPVHSTTSHSVINPIPKEELKISKKPQEKEMKSKSSAKIVSRRSSYSFDSKHPTNKSLIEIKQRERIKQLFGDLSDDDESLTDTGLSTEEEKTQRASSSRPKQSHSKKRVKSVTKKKLYVELSRCSPCKTSYIPEKVRTTNLVKKKTKKTVDGRVSDVKSKSRSTSKERVYDIVKSLTKDSSSSKLSSVSHKKSSSKLNSGKVEDHRHAESVAESRNVKKQTTRKSEPIREKLKNKPKEHNSKTALSKRKQSTSDISSVTPETLLPLREATEEKLGHLELQSCETFDVVKLGVHVTSTMVDNVCTDRGVVTEAPEVKEECLTVKQVEMSSDDSDALVIDLSFEDKSPTKVTDSWSAEEDLKTLLMNPKNNGETVTIYRADESDSNMKDVETVNISLDCNGKSIIKIPVTDKNTKINKDLQKNTAVSHISETNLPQSSAAPKSPETQILPEVNISRQSAPITTQQVLIPNNLSLPPNHQNMSSIRQPSVNVTPSQQSTLFQSAALLNTSIQQQPPPLHPNTLDSMSYQNENFTSSDFITDTTTEELGINDRMKIVEILTRHVYFLAQLCNVQKMYVDSLCQCRYYKTYFKTEIKLFEDEKRKRLQAQSSRLYSELTNLNIKATKNLNHTVMLILENLTISLESRDMPKQATKSMVFLLIWELLKFKIELYTKIPLFKILVCYCHMVINKITSKTLPAHSGEQQRETSSHSLHVNTNVNRSIQPSVPSNTVTQHCQRAPQSNAPVLSKLVSNNPSKDAFAAPKPLTFRRLTPSEFASKHSQATLNPPPAPTGLGNIRTPSPRNAHIPNPNQIPLNLTASSATCPNSSASRNNTFQPQPAPINLSREYNSHANTASSSTEACSAAESTNHNFLSTSTDRQGNTAPAEPNYQIGNCHSSLLLSELLRVGKRDTHSTLNKNLMVNLPFTKPLPYTPKSPSVSTNIDRPKPRINVIQNKVIFPKKHKTRNVRPSNELFKHLRGQASVQNETRPYQLASSEAVSSLNLTGSTERGTLDHYVAKSNVDSNSQDMTFSNNQLTKGRSPIFFSVTCFHFVNFRFIAIHTND